MQQKLINFANTIKPDIIFCVLFTNQFEIETLDYLKSQYTTIGWFGDDQWRFEHFTYKYAQHFTYCITTDKFSISKYIKLGQQNIIYSQWCAINTHQIAKFDGYKYDVTFVGGYNPYRKWFVDTLNKRGINVEAFGYGWKNGSLSAEDMNKVFISSKVNLNISNSLSYDIRYIFRNPMNSLKPIARKFLKKESKNMSQIKARNFEIPYFGGFQLADYIPTIENYFDIGKELICYSNIDEALLLIKYYLENENEREAIKKLGHKKAVENHGFIHRLQYILEHIK